MASPIVSPEMRMVKRASECMGVLIEENLDGSDMQAVIDDTEFRSGLMRFWKSRGRSIEPVTETPSQQRARAIMGANFLGLGDVQRHFGVMFTPDQLATLAEVPFSSEVLEQCKDTHVLFCGFPLTILDIRQRAKKKGVKLFYSNSDDAWYNNEAFAKDAKVNLRWYLIRKEPVENSTSRTYEEQKRLLGSDEDVPRACELTYMVFLHYLVTGVRLFSGIYVRCQDVASDGGRVCLGYFDQDGLDVDGDTGDYRDSGIGLAAARKFK